MGTDTTQEIDLVITWVDGADEAWRRQKAAYLQESKKQPTGLVQEGEKQSAGLVQEGKNTGSADDSAERYRDWGLLKYWFRGVEQFAPWVRKIHFVTWGHLPAWLNTAHPKLHIVRHEDYIPKEFLPIFNSNVLEIYMHRIEGLSEKFVYFNDDVLLINQVKPEDFFVKGKPCDMLAFQPVVANPSNPVMSHLYLNNTLVLSKYFDKRENVKQQPGNYFKIGYPPLYFFYNLLELAFPLYTGLYTVHGASPFCKSTFEEIWQREEESLTAMSNNRFRSESDLTPYLFREWQKLSGNFHAKNLLKDFAYFNVGQNQAKLVKTITGQKKKMLCVNDGQVQGSVEELGAEIIAAFEKILPQASAFER